MSLESIKLERFYEKLPLCASWIGARKSGKSLSAYNVIKYLVSRNAFKRIILFIGNDYCNPELVELVTKKFDERLIFRSFSEEIIQKIIDQQEILRRHSEFNSLLIVWDDCYTGYGRHLKGMNRLFSMGRHFLISCITLCVSFTDVCPSARRSLDFVVLYSNITFSDTYFLTRNFLNKSLIQPARYALKTNRLYQALVIETTPIQKLYLLKFKKRNKAGNRLAERQVENSDKMCLENADTKKFLVKSASYNQKVLNEKTLLQI